MKILLSLSFLFTGCLSFGQGQSLQPYKKYFDTGLRQWTKSFNSFDLSEFRVLDTVPFDNNYEQDLNGLGEFLSIYKPIITYSPDTSKFIDIYSYQINLEKKGDVYYANPDIDQTVFLFMPQNRYWNRIFFGTSSQWIDEIIWTSDTGFILAGISKSGGKNIPLVLLGDTGKQTLVRFTGTNQDHFQDDGGYSSMKLKKINIKGL